MSIFDKKVTSGAGQPDEREIRFMKTIQEIRDGYERKIKHLNEDHERALTEQKLDTELAKKELENKHKLELAQRDFDLKNQKDAEILKYKEEADKAKSDMLVLAKELEVTQKIVDINSDIVDVKDIINKLITALPKIDLSSITVNAK